MKNFATITARYIDRPFAEYTCMGLVHAIYTDLGVAVPDQWEDLSLDNYMEAFKRDPRGIQIRMLKLVRSLGRPSSAQRPHLADLLVVSQATTRMGVIKPGFFPAIYAGRGQALASFLRGGVRLMPLDALNRPIVARRLI